MDKIASQPHRFGFVTFSDPTNDAEIEALEQDYYSILEKYIYLTVGIKTWEK